MGRVIAESAKVKHSMLIVPPLGVSDQAMASPDFLPDEHYQPLNQGFTKREHDYGSLAAPVFPSYGQNTEPSSGFYLEFLFGGETNHTPTVH